MITIDTTATITNLRMDLTNLDSYISVVHFDIDKLNLYVKEKRKQLRNRGEQSQDILVNIFKAYKIIPDQLFNNWLMRKKDNYEEGSDLNADTLMLDALNRFQALKIKGKWQTVSPENKQIIALKAQIDEMHKLMKGTNLKLSKSKAKDYVNKDKQRHEKDLYQGSTIEV